MKRILTILLLTLVLGGCVSKGGVFAWTPMHHDSNDNLYSER